MYRGSTQATPLLGARLPARTRYIYLSIYRSIYPFIDIHLFTHVSWVKGALCALVKRLRVPYNQNDETLSRNSLMYMSKANLT